METGILYAIIAGVFWRTSPVLVKRGLVSSDVSAATLIQQGAILLTLIVFTLWESSVFTGQISVMALLVFIATGMLRLRWSRRFGIRSQS